MLMDKETQIKSLKENKKALEGKVKFLQETCRRAGKQIRRLEEELKEANAWKESQQWSEQWHGKREMKQNDDLWAGTQ